MSSWQAPAASSSPRRATAWPTGSDGSTIGGAASKRPGALLAVSIALRGPILCGMLVTIALQTTAGAGRPRVDTSEIRAITN